jgi:tetratricopeptide (TPR) repeat protein
MPETGDAQSQAQNSAAMALQTKFEQGMALLQQGKLAEAERIYREVLQQQPHHFDALHLLGLVALQTRRTERGVELITKAIELSPNVAAAHCNLGMGLNELKRHEEALASFDKAIALKPDFAEAYNNRGMVLENLNRHEEALANCDKAVVLKPDHAKAYYNRGNALNDLKRHNEALASFDEAIALKPDFAEAYNNRGLTLNEIKRHEEALVSCDKAITLKPDFAGAYHNRGLALNELKRHEEALASYDKAIALKPEFGDAYRNQSLCLLLLGRFEQGWRQYEWRKKCDKPIAARFYPQPLWLGEEDISGKTLFVWWEQGFGDTIQFCRYAKLVEARGAKVIMSVQQPLHELLKQISPTIEIINTDEVPTDFDYHCPLLSLPLAFGTTLETIPAQQPHLKADEQLRLAWSARLPPKTKPRIGLVWSGRTDLPKREDRAIDLEQLLLFLSPDADWICLQKEIREKDLSVLQQLGSIAFFGVDLSDFSDTAALLDAMDLVITIDTSVAHLAGAMGKPVWILLPYSPDWRWLLDRDDSPWYPSARLFRQQQIGNWAGVINQVKDELRSVTR